MPQPEQEATSTHKSITNMKLVINACVQMQGGTENKKNELNIMVEDIDPNIIGITESWANKDITDAEL